MKIIRLFAICLTAFAFISQVASCRSKQEISSSYSTYKFDTTSLGMNADGTVTLRAYGTGADKAKAIEEAKKTAVSDIIFKGIPSGTGFEKTPLVNEVNARERYAEYFDRFFADGGEYRRFVRESSSKDNSRVESKGSSRVNYGIVVDVDRSGLKRQLQSDGILE